MPARPLHVPTEITKAQVQMGAALGRPHQEIADVLGISVWSLRRAYAEILRTAAAKVHLAVGKTIIERATKDRDLIAALAWAKLRMGWSETNRTEISGPEGRPLPVFNISFDDGGPGEPEKPKRLSAPEPEDAQAVLLEVEKG